MKTFSFSVRLVGGPDDYSGRVELFFGGTWASLCGEWNLPDANVVCRQLGLGMAVRARSNSAFGNSPGGKWNLLLLCAGNETHVLYCPREIRSTPCINQRGTDASATCSAGKILQISQCVVKLGSHTLATTTTTTTTTTTKTATTKTTATKTTATVTTTTIFISTHQ